MHTWQSVCVLACVLSCVLSQWLVSGQYDPSQQLSFLPRTLNASWSPRWDSNIEFYNRRMTVVLPNGTTLVWPGRIFILQGQGSGTAAQRSNDVWASPDLGQRWYLIAGRTSSGVSAGGGHATTSFTPLSRPATGMDHNGRIWRVGGSAADGTFSTAVWMSTNGGLNWVNQATLQGANAFSPGRERAGLIFDSADSVYLLGGMWRGDNAMTDTIFKSSNLGVTWPWQDATVTPWQPRGSGLFFNFRANPRAQIDFVASNPNREILVYTTGWNGQAPPNGLSNEVWISSDYSRTWSRVRSNWGNGNAPFRARDAANGEVTSQGVMIIVGGQADDAQGSEQLNDVWVSLDGGYSWGACAEDAIFSDRRELLTVLDDQGYLYVGGGLDSRSNRELNDFWRSSFSFDNITTVMAACGLTMPACGPGLTCWPGDPRTTFYSNGTVTCPASRACAGQVSEAYLDFEPQTLSAPWSKRWAANVELFPRSFAYRTLNGVQRQAPANALILSGGQGQNNDVWMSPDGGESWTLIAGYASYTAPIVRAGGVSAESSFSPALSESTGIVDNRNGAIYRVGGYNSGGEANDVWRTTNAVSWTKQAATNLPARSGSNVVVDDRGRMYVVGGVANGRALSDIWYSDDNATTFGRPTLQTAPFFKPSRAKGFLLHRYSWQLQRDILFFGTGWDGTNLYNDIWVSSDSAASWTLVCSAAPFEPRDAAFAEITSNGLIILGGGQTGPYTQNDVWVSPDGGYTWSVCGSEHYWPDRRDVSAVFDQDEYFYIMGGRETANANAPMYNDVYRSTFPLSDLAKVAQACSINIPWCGAGLSCWPGDAGTTTYEGGVTCQMTRWCEGNSTNPNWRSSSTGGAGQPPARASTARVRPFDPCRDMIPVPPECDNYDGASTGYADVKTGGLTTWAIGGIVVLVAAVVGGLLFFMYRRCRGGSAQEEGKLNSSLLGTTGSETA